MNINLKTGKRSAFALLAACFLMLMNVAGCSEEPLGLPHPVGILNWPATLATDSDGRHIYVINTNFDQKYRSGSVAVVDIEERLLLSDRTVAVDAFGGIPSLLTEGAGLTSSELLVPTREEDKLYRIKIARTEGEAPRLECNANEETTPPTCSGSAGLNAENDLAPGEEPYASTLIRDAQNEVVILVTAGLIDGVVSFFSLPDEEPAKKLLDFEVDTEIQSMVFHQGTGELLFTHRRLSGIYALPISIGLKDGAPSITAGEKRFVFLPGDPLAGDYGREIAIAPNGHQVAVVWRSPASLRMLEPDSTLSSGYRLASEIPLGRSPSELVFAPFGAEGEERAFVTCHRDDQVYVLDMKAGLVTEVIKVGKGPFGIAAINRPELDRQIIVTANFEDDTLSVIEGNPDSPFHLNVIAHVHNGESIQ